MAVTDAIDAKGLDITIALTRPLRGYSVQYAGVKRRHRRTHYISLVPEIRTIGSDVHSWDTRRLGRVLPLKQRRLAVAFYRRRVVGESIVELCAPAGRNYNAPVNIM
jgi:hypothetical protein